MDIIFMNSENSKTSETPEMIKLIGSTKNTITKDDLKMYLI